MFIKKLNNPGVQYDSRGCCHANLMNLKRVLRADEEGVEEGYRDEQEESDEVHCSGQHPQTFGTVRVRQRSDHTTVKSTVILVKSIAKFPIYT